MKSSLQTIAAAVLTSVLSMSPAGTAQAHGEQPHTKTPASQPKEQKPWGIAGDAEAVGQTITFSMTDAMRFTPDRVTVRQGDTIRFVLKNEGKQLHEFVLGTKKDLAEHAALMLKFPNMEHDEPYMAHVAPGTTGTVIWTFNRAGQFDFACLIAGHFEAGMTGTVDVVAR